MLDRAIISIMCMLFLILLLVFMVGMVITITQKIEFDQFCRASLYEMDLAGGMTDPMRIKLNSDLCAAGYLNVKITAPLQVQYGNWMKLTVSADVPGRNWISLFHPVEGTVHFTYDRSIVSRKIHNMAY